MSRSKSCNPPKAPEAGIDGKPVRIAVMGAGAVGCYYGGLLARAGHDVVLIGRAGHVEAIRRDGLWLETTTFSERIAVAASTHAEAARNAHIILFCVKSTDTQPAAAQLAPHLAPSAIVLSLQNGVDNADRLRQQLPQEIIPAAVYVAAEMAGPGHMRHHGRGELVIGESRHHPTLLALFGQAGIPIRVSPKIADELWAKLIVNCVYNALSGITQLPYGRLVQTPGALETLDAILAECLRVAKADGIIVPTDIHNAISGIAQTMPNQSSSTAQDLQRGRPTEIDHLNGYVVTRGQAHNIPTPINRLLHMLIKAQENTMHRERPSQKSNERGTQKPDERLVLSGQ